ncbi:MAG: hypothetical protein OXS35_03735 [Dehalococcoidia bacterium]|nr:hypothetical protein [Dehalococcoidia bacterium]
MPRFGRLTLPILLALFLVVLASVACGGNGDSQAGTSQGTPGESPTADSPTATPAAETQTGAELTALEYWEALEEILSRAEAKAEAATSEVFSGELYSREVGERMTALEASDSWSQEDAEAARDIAERMLQAFTGLLDANARITADAVDALSRLAPPEHLSQAHGDFVAALREGTQEARDFLAAELEAADTDVTNREEFTDFLNSVESLGAGPADSALGEQIETACLALEEKLQAELEQDVDLRC